jgi:hypothetical protein
MPTNTTLVDPWTSFFSDIDASLAAEVVLHCLGGFVMTMLYGSERLTADVDVLPITSDPASKNLLHLAVKDLHFIRNTRSIFKLLGWPQCLITMKRD